VSKVVALNAYQKAVVEFRHGFAVTVAAPGSGKTAVMVERLKALLREGIKPSEVLSLTFTKEGAKELTERADLDDVKEKVCSTFHSWALAFIKREAFNLPFKVKTDFHGHPAPLLLPLEACRLLATLCRGLERVQWKDAQSFISRMKRRGISPAQAFDNMENDGEEKFIKAYYSYEKALRDKGVLDFDSVVIETANLLRTSEDVRARNQFKYVQVDEAQDTDAVQWSIIKAISSRHGNALAVGDENQGMFSWRGSESNLTSYFCNLFPGARVFPLPVNYRSTQSIVKYCQEIAPVKNETVTNLSTPNELGVEPTFRLYGREDEEAHAVILGCQDHGNTAILARTNRQLASFENECAQRNIRYKLLGKSGFWNQHEVKDVVAMLSAVVRPTDANVLRTLTSKCEATKFMRKSDTKDKYGSVTHRGVPSVLKEMAERDGTTVNNLLLHYHGEGSEATMKIGMLLRELRSTTRGLRGGDAMKKVIDAFGAMSVYDEDDDNKDVDNDPRDNILKIIEYGMKRNNLEDLYEWTQKVQRSLRARTNCIVLSTIHQSKGKEWKYVFVVGVNQDVLPHIKGDLQEEHRIYFVACSRAALKLHVSANGVASELIRHKLPENGTGLTIDPWEGYSLLQKG